MKNFLPTALAMMLACWAGGCSLLPENPPSGAPMVTCHVCEHYRDLGCVCFRLKPTTPQLTHDGVEYFFCGADCRDEFQKNPAKFLTKAAAK